MIFFCNSLNIWWTNFEVTLKIYEEGRVLTIILGAMWATKFEDHWANTTSVMF